MSQANTGNETPKPKHDEPDDKTTDHCRILIVDDEYGIRELFCHVLSCNLPNCRTDVAVNGAEAVESFRQTRQGVIVMDLYMPVMNGDLAFDAIQKMCIENEWTTPYFIFCTGYEPPYSLRKIVDEDPRHCVLHKPISNAALLGALQLRLQLYKQA